MNSLHTIHSRYCIALYKHKYLSEQRFDCDDLLVSERCIARAKVCRAMCDAYHTKTEAE